MSAPVTPETLTSDMVSEHVESLRAVSKMVTVETPLVDAMCFECWRSYLHPETIRSRFCSRACVLRRRNRAINAEDRACEPRRICDAINARRAGASSAGT